MRTQTANPSSGRKLKTALGLAAIAALALPASAGAAGSGGVGTEGTGDEKVAPGGKAKLVKGKAVAPADAPPEVMRAIQAANKIVKRKGYCLGGGHARWGSKCYDCSGSVSYALGKKGARVLKAPMPSTGFMRWEDRGKGAWITTYSNPGHMYAVIAGLRLDTSMTAGAGPGWSKKMRSGRGYRKRHPRGF